MRINGFSGLDVDTMVKEMMKPYNVRVDSQRQQRDTIKWKQELYRDTTKNMRGFYNKYFDVLSKDYILSSSKLSSTKATSMDPSILDVTGLSGAKTGTYKVKIDKLAEAANVTSEVKLSDGLKTKLDLAGDTELAFNVNGTNKKVIIKKDSTVEDMIATINSSLKDAGVKASYSEFSGKLLIENTKTGSNSSLEINGLENIKVGGNNLFALGGSTTNYGQINLVKDFKVDGNTSLKSLSGTEIKIPASYGKDGKEQVIKIEDTDTVTTLMDKLKASVKDESKVVFKDGKLLFDESTILNTTNLINEKLSLQDLNLKNEVLTIGGQDVNLQNIDTVKDLMNEIDKVVNSDPNKPKQSVTFTNGVLKFGTGSEGNIAFTGNGLEKYSYNENKGSDAEFRITLPDGKEYPENPGETFKSETNSFTKDNITFNFNSTTEVGKEVSFTVKNDVSDTVDKIVSFVDEYNKMVDDIYSKVTTKKNKHGEYLPLTEDQRKAMSEDEIKRWEEKGKNGLLKGDMLLSSILADIRGVFDSYSGLGKELNRMGIGLTSDTTKPNRLQIDKEKLTKALETEGDEVIKTLISTEKETVKGPYGNDIQRSKGALTRLKDTIYDSSMKYGAKLLEKAGFDGTASSSNNELSKAIAQRDDKIKSMEKDLRVRENMFYLKFSKLETAMSKFNAQQSSMMQQFGGGM